MMPAAHIAPPAMRVTPARNIAVSNRVISQLLRMARLNCLTPQLFRLTRSRMVQIRMAMPVEPCLSEAR